MQALGFNLKKSIFFIICILSVNAQGAQFEPIDNILKGLEYQSIGQSRYSFVVKENNKKIPYPKCRVVFNKIYHLYGGPDIVQKFWEESMFTHRRVWKKGEKSLSLRCFNKGGARYAEYVSLY